MDTKLINIIGTMVLTPLVLLGLASLFGTYVKQVAKQECESLVLPTPTPCLDCVHTKLKETK